MTVEVEISDIDPQLPPASIVKTYRLPQTAPIESRRLRYLHSASVIPVLQPRTQKAGRAQVNEQPTYATCDSVATLVNCDSCKAVSLAFNSQLRFLYLATGAFCPRAVLE